jgi:hypothetical protein
MTAMKYLRGLVGIALAVWGVVYTWQVLRGPHPDYKIIIPALVAGFALGIFLAVSWRIRHRQSNAATAPQS